MSAHVLLIISYDLRKRDKIQGLSNISSLFCNEFKMQLHRSTNVRISVFILWHKNTLKSRVLGLSSWFCLIYSV